MKVKIGNYPYSLTCNIHGRYMNKKYGVNWPTVQTSFENSLEKVEDFIFDYFCCPINRLFFNDREQKIKVHIDPWDTWSMDSTLAYIVLPMLKQLKATKHGAPFVDDEDVPEEIRTTSAPPKANSWDVDEYHFKRWDWVLNEMILAFECKVDPSWEEEFLSKNGEMYFECFKNYQKRIANGFRLFGKYYESLWD